MTSVDYYISSRPICERLDIHALHVIKLIPPATFQQVNEKYITEANWAIRLVHKNQLRTHACLFL